MARVTIEDCLEHVENRFALVLKAAKRAHLLETGAATPLVPINKDKPTVIALREIAAGFDIENAPLRTEHADLENVITISSMHTGGIGREEFFRHNKDIPPA